ncbi:polysaccharide biosynthesis protein [Macrococcus armenti]|uniref:polysaccharide biosynthesis protein n=1 Tax=Macrococcus armenti TaxID=2875764 RepID=UPI001CCA5AB4|nr:polysaccharide biosynthesis protein [Macrococcus armenti]UBH13067.1 polysaccharide biosynthesis protein [Macrococcus armenti]
MESKPVFNSVIILTFTMLLVKVLSAIYRVPYQNILGDTGLYAYQQVYPIIAIVSVLSLNAIPSVVSQSRYSNTFMKQLHVWLFVISVSLVILTALCSEQIAQMMGDRALSGMLKVSALVLLPFPFVSLARGILQKRHMMEQIAISQVIDQVIRVGTILIAILLYVNIDLTVYDSGVISILGSFLGLSGAFVYLKYKGIRITDNETNISEEGSHYRQFITLIFFYSLSYLVLIIWQLVDSFTIINQLKQVMSLNEARDLKGIYDRGSSLIQVGLIVTTSFSLVLIPVLAKCKHDDDIKNMQSYASSALKITIIFSSAAAVGLMNLIRPLNLFLFKTVNGYEALAIYMISVIFVSLIIMFTAMLQIFNAYKVQVAAVAIGVMMKLILNVIMVQQFNIVGASIATVAGLFMYAAILYINVKALYDLSLNTFLVRWIGTLIVMSVLIQCVLLIPFDSRMQAMGVSLIGIVIGLIIVLYAMIKWKIISIDEWHHLPFGNVMIKFMKE